MNTNTDHLTTGRPSDAGDCSAATCQCLERTRTGSSPLLLTHLPDCEHFLGDIAGLLRSLVRGIEEWAADEDGVHGECWNAYQRAKVALGEPVSVESV